MTRLFPTWSRTAAFVLALAAGGPACALDCAGGWFEYTCDRFNEAIDHGRNDLYVPFHSHHGRSTYTPERIEELNEQTWGVGYGRSVIDLKGDWHAFYVMGFRDSHFKPEYLAGYGYQTYWGRSDSLQAGLGYTVFLTVRSDYADYHLPVPAILPMGSLRYKNASLMATYLPRISVHKGNGDVLFFFAHFGF
jgi:palmitoyl transferase